jgi:hypothetical protein
VTNPNSPDSLECLRDLLISVRRRLGKLTVAVLLLCLAVMLCAAAIFGNLLNYFGGDSMLGGAIFCVAALLGFGLGWYAGRKA